MIRRDILPNFTVKCSPDGLKASLFVPEEYADFYPDFSGLEECLTKNGIVYGIKDDILRQMISGRICGKQVLVAEGKPPQPGTPGRIEMMVDTSQRGKPRKKEDGSVDLQDIQNIIIVKNGQPLARRIPPVRGKEGVSVYGNPILAQPVKDVTLKTGKGTKISEDDPNLLLAAAAGDVLVDENGNYSVVEAKTINGDIDYTVGNISFSGELKITGTVRSGFRVTSDGNIYIRGGVEDAVVSSEDDVVIIGGAAGSEKGIIESGRSVNVHHIENFTVRAVKDVIVREDALHSTVKAGGKVRAKTIVGGVISANEGVEAESVGSSIETRTELDLGGNSVLREEKNVLQRKIKKNNNSIAALMEDVYSFVKINMDKNGKLAKEKEETLAELKDTRRKLIENNEKLDERIKHLEVEINKQPKPVIKIKRIFPNTVIKYGVHRKQIDKDVYNAVISVEDDKIQIFEGGKG